MSKASRARARAVKQSSVPKSFIIIGVLAVLGVAGYAVKSMMASASPAPMSVASAAPAGSPSPGVTPAAHGKKLLFFMNPNGYPCQTQLSILNTVADSLSKVAQVVYIKTTEPADMQTFEAYGIRALPSLVIADENGRELSRFAPGIQSGEAVLAALSK